MADRDFFIMQWVEARHQLEAAKQKEINFRLQMLAQVFNFHQGRDDRIGKEHLDLGKGYALDVDFKQNYNLNQKKIRETIYELGFAYPDSLPCIKDLIRWKGELNVGPYLVLPPAIRKRFDKIVTSKPALPSVNLKTPAGKGFIL